MNSLKNENVLEEEINSYVRKNNLFNLSQDELTSRADCPPSGMDNYEMIKRTWQEKGWQNLLDYLRYYNEMDVRPFFSAILVYLDALCQNNVDPLLTCCSLPGVLKKVLSNYNLQERSTTLAMENCLLLRREQMIEVSQSL